MSAGRVKCAGEIRNFSRVIPPLNNKIPYWPIIIFLLNSVYYNLRVCQSGCDISLGKMNCLSKKNSTACSLKRLAEKIHGIRVVFPPSEYPCSEEKTLKAAVNIVTSAWKGHCKSFHVAINIKPLLSFVKWRAIKHFFYVTTMHFTVNGS
jgi:hypothetical protein